MNLVHKYFGGMAFILNDLLRLAIELNIINNSHNVTIIVSAMCIVLTNMCFTNIRNEPVFAAVGTVSVLNIA